MILYFLTVLSIFLLFYIGINRKIFDSLVLASAITFLLMSSGFIKPMKTKAIHKAERYISL